MVQDTLYDWSEIQSYIPKLEQEGFVTRTFRRLDPERQQAILTGILDEAVERGPTAINIKQVAERAKDAGVSAVVFDRGGFKYHGRIRALADAAREAGLEF